MIPLRVAFIALACIHSVVPQAFNPTILQDSRLEPKVDGTFGFMYRTEDGIINAAKGNSNGVIQGRYSYTDPTGLKVNFNYNAGSRFTPGYNYNSNVAGGAQQPAYNEPEDDGQYHEDPSIYYKGEQAESAPRSKYQPKYEVPQNARPQFRSQESYQQPISRRRHQNDLYEDDLYTRAVY